MSSSSSSSSLLKFSNKNLIFFSQNNPKIRQDAQRQTRRKEKAGIKHDKHSGRDKRPDKEPEI